MALEVRYIVFKIKDVQRQSRRAIRAAFDVHNLNRKVRGAGPLDGIFIERDWPEFDTVCKLLEDRMKAEQEVRNEELAALSLAWCSTCAKEVNHHGDPDSIHLHLCNECNSPVGY